MADTPNLTGHIMSDLACPFPPGKQTFVSQIGMSASLIGRFGSSAFRLSSHSSVDVACGLVLLFGLGAKALPVWDSRMRGTIFGSALPSRDGRSKQTCDLTSSIVPQGTSFHRAVQL